jgi:hypothetical protein
MCYVVQRLRLGKERLLGQLRPSGTNTSTDASTNTSTDASTNTSTYSCTYSCTYTSTHHGVMVNACSGSWLQQLEVNQDRKCKR